ncbi:MAG: DUF192 domain-containing protein [bacterium]|nr:DUF192 domain-containing protein [bacterium]
MANKSKINKELFFAFLLIASVIFVFFILLRKEDRGSMRQTATITIRDTAISVEIADTSEKRALGLGGREALGENEGMFFIFEQPGYHAFWMRNMKFPLDIIWIDENLTIAHVQENISPDTFPNQYAPDEPVQYVLEVQAGFAETHGITTGDRAEFRRSGTTSQ